MSGNKQVSAYAKRCPWVSSSLASFFCSVLDDSQVSHPRHQRPTISDAGRGREKGVNPKTDRGWGGAGAVGWGVLGAFGSIDKDTGAQVSGVLF